jgi:hypothetical protein
MKTGDWKLDRHVPEKFLKKLRDKFQDGVFLNMDAYKVYYDVSWTYKQAKPSGPEWAWQRRKQSPKRVAIVEDQWLQMNTRNYLSMAATQGIIRRVAPGVYEFV